MLLATLITAQNARPFRPLPMLFPPILVLSSYMNVSGYTIDSAGLTGAWSGLYLLLAARRRQTFASKFSPRGLIRGASMATCAANVVGGGVTYFLARRKTEAERRG